MAYKITKYKGKTKIKDAKTGKSREIDIEKFMSGGEMPVPEYAYGTEFDCPPGDEECWKRKQQFFNNPMGEYFPQMSESQNQNLPYTGPYNAENMPGQRPAMATETAPRPAVSVASSLQPKGVSLGVDTAADLNKTQLSEDDMKLNSQKSSEPNSENNRPFHIFNPYAGVDIPSAANYLGRSIKNNDALGIAASSLKVAAGLGRNVVSGLGYQNRYNQVMQDYYKKQKNNRSPVQYYAYGGKKDEEFATGEYMRGIENEERENYNAEIEKGEYFQTNEGDIAEVVGDKHSNGGEKIQMEAEDRVLSDKLKLGGKLAKELSKKFDLKLKAANTYADVLDKYKKKSKLGKLVDEESEILKKINDQESVEDTTTRDFNLQVLNQKREEILEQKHPIEEKRKEMFDELFDMQEASKKGKDFKKQENLEYGGKLESLAKEYNIPIERAREIVKQYSEGGKYTNGGPGKGKKVTRKEAEKKVREGAWKDLGNGQYMEEGTDTIITTSDVERPSYIDAWNSGRVDKSQYPTYQDFKKAAEDWNNRNPRQVERTEIQGTPDNYYYARMPKVQPQTFTTPLGVSQPDPGLNVGLSDADLNRKPSQVEPNFNPESLVYSPEKEQRGRTSGAGLYLFPDESPLPPSGLQGSIKPEARFDRVRATEIDIDPYLQDIRAREQAQVNSLEGLSPNVRAAVLSNLRANSQQAESNVRNKIDTQNLASQEKAQYTNAQLQRQEQILNNNYRQGYEARVYKAQAISDQEMNNYYNQLQAINKQRFMDIHNLNLINARNEDIFFDGQSFRRRNTDSDLVNKYLQSKNLK